MQIAFTKSSVYLCPTYPKDASGASEPKSFSSAAGAGYGHHRRPTTLDTCRCTFESKRGYKSCGTALGRTGKTTAKRKTSQNMGRGEAATCCSGGSTATKENLVQRGADIAARRAGRPTNWPTGNSQTTVHDWLGLFLFFWGQCADGLDRQASSQRLSRR